MTKYIKVVNTEFDRFNHLLETNDFVRSLIERFGTLLYYTATRDDYNQTSLNYVKACYAFMLPVERETFLAYFNVSKQVKTFLEIN